MLRALRHLVFFVSLAFVAGIARDARADTATAQALFDQAKKLMGEKKYAEACAKFEESQRLDPGLGTQNNLAVCYESLGRTASAWSLYLEVASQAKATNQPDREKKARDAAKALEPKLSKLTIEVTSPPAGLEVKRNGALVGQATWGTPIPVDPGEVQITAMAPNRKLWEKSITVDKPGEQTVTVPQLEKGQTPAGYGTPIAPAGTATPPSGPVPGYYGSTPQPPQRPAMKRRSGGLFGGGIAMVVVGGIATIGGAAAAAISSFDGDPGPAAGVALFGLAMVAGGSVMIAVGNKKVPVDSAQSKPPPVSPVPEIHVGLGSAALKWEF